jgi:cell division protein FtsL
MAGVFVVMMALLVVFRYGQISHINMEINRLNNTRSAVIDEQRHLEIAIAQLTALDRLEQVAIGELGMQYPHPDQIRFIGYKTSESGDGDGE